MRLPVLSLILTFIVFAASLSACRKENNTTNNTTLTGKWKLIKYHNLTARTSEPEPANIPRSIIIDFSDNGLKGKMNGHTVTNFVSGEYELLQNNKIKTVSFGGTKVGEPGWGNKFWDAIYSASSYELQGDKLFIFFKADSEKMEFKKE
jgi:hypothetical protein